MIILTLYLFGLFLVIAAGVYAARSDYKGMVIPNKISIAILSVFAVYAALMSFTGNAFLMPLQSHLIGGIIMFVLTFFIFMAKIMGGGDAKLMTAYAFWFGIKGLIVFLFYTALFGALLAVAALWLKKKKPCEAPTEGSWVQRVQAGESAIPYGIPILIGAILSFIKLGYFSPAYLASFL